MLESGWREEGCHTERKAALQAGGLWDYGLRGQVENTAPVQVHGVGGQLDGQGGPGWLVDELRNATQTDGVAGGYLPVNRHLCPSLASLPIRTLRLSTQTHKSHPLAPCTPVPPRPCVSMCLHS